MRTSNFGWKSPAQWAADCAENAGIAQYESAVIHGRIK